MTDLLTRDEPSDTGEIPRIDSVGEGTRNLAPYLHGLPPALRRPTAALPIYTPYAGCRRIDWNDDDFGPSTPPPPSPLPPTPAPPKVADEILWDSAYVGRHRAPEDLPAEVLPGRFGALRSVLATAWARVWSAR